jgi:teichuronic acid biosynthesis glycosyltransferase TuaC
MNILILSHMFPNCRDWSSGVFVLEQAKRLRAAGINAIVVSPIPWAPRSLGFHPSVRKYMEMPKHTTIEGFSVEYPRVPTLPRRRGFSLSGLLFYLSCRRLVRKLLTRTNFDLIHAHTMIPDGFGAILLGREFHLPVVCTAHGSDILAYPRESRAVGGATKWVLRRAGHLIAVSEDLKRRIQAMVGEREVHVAHNGADAEIFGTIARSTARLALGLPLDKKIICFVGYLRPEKGLDFLLEAFSRLGRTDTILCLVGDGPLRNALTLQVHRLGISGACVFTGAQLHGRIPVWLAAADCLVLCSLNEGLPTILPEAMLCGVPVIATPVGGVPEIVRPLQTGLLVPPGDPVALADAMTKVLSDPEAAADMANRARTFAANALTWDANVRKTISVYEIALKRSVLAGRDSDYLRVAC